MTVGRITVMVLLGALLAMPMAYAQINEVLEGAGLVMAAFGQVEVQTAALGQ